MKLKQTKVATLAATLITFGMLGGGANAAIILSDVGGKTQITFTTPITFQATSTVSSAPPGLFFGLIAEDYFTANTIPFTGNPTSGGIPVVGTTTGGSIGEVAPLISQNALPGNLYDRNDLVINFLEFSVFPANATITTGDLVTFGAGSVLTSIDFSSLPAVTSSPVSVTMVDASYNAISVSQTVAVPEPSVAILGGVGALALVGLRRRQR